MKFTAQQIATLVQGEVVGNETAMVGSIAKIEDSKVGDLCFLANAKYEDYLYETKASVVIVNDTLVLKKEVSATLIRVKDAYASFALILKTYEDYTTAKPKEIIEQPSFISTTAKVGEKVYIGAFAYLGENVVVGENTKIYPNAYLGDNVKIGANTIIYAGVKIYKDCVETM
jgi:UDP-3-O-[3-hydroxymyristoyl] glucosamine N-acyltransferase